MSDTVEKKKRYEGRRRLSLDITEQLYDRLNKNFEWGERTKVVIGLLEYACDMVEKKGPEALAVFLRAGDFASLSRKVVEESSNGND